MLNLSNRTRSLSVCLSFSLLFSACTHDEDGEPSLPSSEELVSGLKTMMSGDRERSYYLQLPGEYIYRAEQSRVSLGNGSEPKPLIIGFHGSFGSYKRWIGDDRAYDFVDIVGDDAIMVFPNATQLADGQVNWNFEFDFEFFQDLIAELNRLELNYDLRRVFVVGHSSGAGMAQEIGCRFGDIVRAIAASSGSLISTTCVGAIGVIQTQGEVDTAVPIGIGSVARNTWNLYNGWDINLSIDGVVEQCVDHSLLPLGSADYPVQWCQHPGGHAWADFNSQAFWAFFSGLPTVDPSVDPPPGGGNDRVLAAADTTITFRLQYPEDISPVVAGALSLYPEGFTDGQFAAPSIFLNPTWSPGQVAAGSEVLYENVPITFFVFSGELDLDVPYVLQISIYVEGGSQPIPTPGVDHKVLLPIEFVDRTTPIVIEETLVVEPVVPWF